MNDRIKFLSLSELFRDISPKDLNGVFELLQEETIPANTQVFHEDDISDAIFILKEGSVKITLRAVWRMQKEDIITIIRPGEIFGEFSFIDGARRSASAMALDDITVFTLSRADFDVYAIKHPTVATTVMHNIAWLLTQKIRNTNMLYRSLKI